MEKTLKFVSPMLATATTILPPGRWVAEEKYDGHRIIVAREEDGDVLIQAWTRTGKAPGTSIQRAMMSVRMSKSFRDLPTCILDGEFVMPSGGYSSNVSDLANSDKLKYVVFDVLNVLGRDVTSQSYSMRRAYLEEIMSKRSVPGVIELAPAQRVSSWREVMDLSEAIWNRGGEGVILKAIDAPYRPGKRTKTFLKVKECRSAVLTIIGFARSEGEIMQYGDYGTAVLRDTTGVVVPVKILDDETRARIAKVHVELGGWRDMRLLSGVRVSMHTSHPWVGRKLHIEYQMRTPDGSYRHPRWDRLDGE